MTTGGAAYVKVLAQNRIHHLYRPITFERNTLAGVIPGAVLEYDMETLVNGQMKDLSGNGNHGTITGTTDVAGQFGRARRFV